MILIDNINILKSAYPNVWSRLKFLENTMDNTLIQVEETRRGDKKNYMDRKRW